MLAVVLLGHNAQPSVSLYANSSFSSSAFVNRVSHPISLIRYTATARVVIRFGDRGLPLRIRSVAGEGSLLPFEFMGLVAA